jgi:hypothetical protein
LLKETGYRRTIFRAAAVLATGCGDPVQLGFGGQRFLGHPALGRRSPCRASVTAFGFADDERSNQLPEITGQPFLAMMDNAHDDITDQEISQYDQPLANVRLAASIGRLDTVAAGDTVVDSWLAWGVCTVMVQRSRGHFGL